MRDVEWLQIWCRPVEANVNVCRQTRLRWADRREMASTCCRAGPSTPLHLYVCVCVCIMWGTESSLSRAPRGQQRVWHPLVLGSLIRFFNHLQVNAPQLTFHLTLNITLSLLLKCVFPLHRLLSLLAYAPYSSCSSPSGCLSTSTSLALFSLLEEKTPTLGVFFLCLLFSCHLCTLKIIINTSNFH